MAIKFQGNELSIAYSMIAAASRIRPRRDGSQLYQKYFLMWTAFNSIYSAIANRKGCEVQLKTDDDGVIITAVNGHVKIPVVIETSEADQIDLAVEEFSNGLKHKLILHDGTDFFAHRVPYWQGERIEYDTFGQKLNGVIHVYHTTDSQYPVWSPIDLQFYEAYLENLDDQVHRDFLARQIVSLLHTVRANMMQGSRKLDDSNDIQVVQHALPMLELIVSSFAR